MQCSYRQYKSILKGSSDVVVQLVLQAFRTLSIIYIRNKRLHFGKCIFLSLFLSNGLNWVGRHSATCNLREETSDPEMFLLRNTRWQIKSRNPATLIYMDVKTENLHYNHIWIVINCWDWTSYRLCGASRITNSEIRDILALGNSLGRDYALLY